MANKNKKKLRIVSLIAVLVIILGTALGLWLSVSDTVEIPTKDEAMNLIAASAEQLKTKDSKLTEAIISDLEIEINSVESKGTGCEVNVTFTSYDASVLLGDFIDGVIAVGEPNEFGETLKSDAMKAAISEAAEEKLAQSEKVSTTVDVTLVNSDGQWAVFKSEELASAATGGLTQFDLDKLGYGDEVPPAIKRFAAMIEVKFDTVEPDTRNWIEKDVDGIKDQFVLNFITKARWKTIVSGLLNTLKITCVSLVIGVAIGIVVAAIRSSYDNNIEDMEKRGGIGYYLMTYLNLFCKLYLNIIRGTPVVVQLLIYYFIIFVSVKDGTVVAMIAFGINSGAYVAEIFRGGIMSIDNGQFEAGRSLGFNYVKTMLYVIIPQVFKVVLPSLCNEFIALIKETSIAGYVGIMDLTKAGDIIRGRTFSAFMPLIAVALIYLALVLLLTWLVSKLERRLRKNER